MLWRLGIDLGTNSLGWAALELNENHEPIGLFDCGGRIFSDGRIPKDKQSNAAKRREPRGARKNRDRYKRRRQRLMRQLIQFGLMPEDEAARKALEGGKGVPQNEHDPWILRAHALDKEITPHQLGRALFHLHQRRGFKSNRKTDRGDSESGKVYDAINKTKQSLKEKDVRTLGELFGKPRFEIWQQNQSAAKGKKQPQPLARVRSRGTGDKMAYDYYPTRELILDEFDQLWAAQKPFHSALLTEEARQTLRDTIEWQHPLKPQPVGKCTLMPEFPRAPKALPSAQRIRIMQEVNNLRIGQTGKAQRALTLEERNKLADSLLNPTSKTAKRSFDQLRKTGGFSTYDNFNLESEKRKDLTGDQTAAALMQDERWGESWFELDLATQDEIVLKLIDTEDKEELITWLCSAHGLDREQAFRVVDTPLADGHANLSVEAIARLLPCLEAEVIVYSEAVIKAGFDSHSQFATGEVHDRLPYYGYVLERSVAFGSGDPNDSDEKRYGRVANPTVHVALNQIRAVVNDLIKRYGAPEQIVIELARDLPLSARGKSELNTEQAKNQKANEERAKCLEEEFKVPNTYENRLRLRLYDELDALDKSCVFSGEQIGGHNLFTSEVEIEHILPFSRTLDDGYANKVLSTRQANRDKANKSPYEAFSHSPGDYNWEEISKRANALPDNKAWRFGPDAMERYENEERDFLARQLNDTRHTARLARAYLASIYGGEGTKGATNHVWVVTGQLTADLRHQWGLNSVLHSDNIPEAEMVKKNRADHRHHAIDAIVIGCIDRSMLKRASDEAQKRKTDYDPRLLAGLADPWENFRSDVAQKVNRIIVSHKPDHGFQDAMHNDTAYGMAKGKEGEPDKRGARLVATRKPIENFENAASLEKIRDYDIKMKLLEATQGLSGTAFTEALLATAHHMTPPVHRVRIEEKLSVIPISDKSGTPYKAYKGDGNYCYDIWMGEKGKWDGEVISTFEAYQLDREFVTKKLGGKRKKGDRYWWQGMTGRSGQKLLMRLRKGDYLEIDHDEQRVIMLIYEITPGKVIMDEPFKAKGPDRFSKSPSSLQKAKAKPVTVSPSGVVRVYD